MNTRLVDRIYLLIAAALLELAAILRANKTMGEALEAKANEVPKCGTLEVVPKDQSAPPPMPKKPASSLPSIPGPRRTI